LKKILTAGHYELAAKAHHKGIRTLVYTRRHDSPPNRGGQGPSSSPFLALGAATLRPPVRGSPVSLGTDRIAQTVLGKSQTPAAKKNELTMRNADEIKQPDLWTWIVIGIVFGAVTAALYGPFIWEHWVV